MSKKRGNKKNKDLDDDFPDDQSVGETPEITSKSKGKAKKGKKGNKDDDSVDGDNVSKIGEDHEEVASQKKDKKKGKGKGRRKGDSDSEEEKLEVEKPVKKGNVKKKRKKVETRFRRIGRGTC